MSSPIHIAHIVGKMVGGGVESVIMNYYRHIDRNSIQFDFIIDNDSTLVPEEEIESLGGRVIRISPYGQPLQYHRDLYTIFKENHYIIVHSHINTLSVFPLFAAKRAGVPVRIAHNHSTAAKGELKKNVLKYMLRPFAKLFPTHLCACSEYAARWMFGKASSANGDIKIIPNAIDLSKFHFSNDTRNNCRRQLGLEDKFVVGHVGRFMYPKNHQFLIDIFYEVTKKDESAVLLLIGTGKLRQGIQDKVHLLKLNNTVKFLGYREDIAEMMKAMDVFVLPSFCEGLPVVGVEAQATGLPCVFSDRVPREAKMSPMAEFVRLDAGAENWAKVVLSYRGFRERHEYHVDSPMYDITYAANELKEYYLRLYTECS
ncbi:MAG: glycosyltransferase family 1 protein [Angelakisella sp.]